MASKGSPENRALHKGARLLFSGTDKASRLLRDLCEHLVDIPGNKLPLAAAAALVDGLPTSAIALGPLLSGFSFITLQRSNEVCLNVKGMLEHARKATSTGILQEELPAPTGYVYGKHPVRPGQHNCSYYMQNGVCTFEQRCVYNHPAKHKNDVLPYCISSSSAAASGGSSTGGTTSNGHSTKHPPASPAAAAHRTSSFTAAAPAEAAASHHAWNQPQQQPQPPSRSAAAAGPVRPGQPRCIMMRTRGICTAGPNCPYDHTPDSRTASPSPTHATTGPGSAPAAAQHHAAPLVRTDVPAPTPVAAAAPASSSAAAAAGGTSPALVGQSSPRSAEQERQLQENMKRFMHCRDKSGSLNGFTYPVTGTTADGYPQRPGAANCTYYMYSGECKFKSTCVYHHPDHVAHPIRFITTGGASRRWPAEDPVPFSRLLMFLDRLWDYTSCCECQLKKWLAYYLICTANPQCSMWDKSAAQYVVSAADNWSAGDQAAAAAAGMKPLGPYSCSLSEAGMLLHKLWSEQPDEDAAAHPMPYHKRVRELLSTDPYFEVAPDPNNASHMHVRLNVGRIREMLNW